MSNKYKNYNKFSKAEETTEVLNETVVEETVETAEVVETVNEPVNIGPKIGRVTGCEKLNVRNRPNGKIVTVIESGTELIVDEEKSNTEWVNVALESGVEGFCMRKFVNIPG